MMSERQTHRRNDEHLSDAILLNILAGIHKVELVHNNHGHVSREWKLQQLDCACESYYASPLYIYDMMMVPTENVIEGKST